jgi:hypothetical protein
LDLLPDVVYNKRISAQPIKLERWTNLHSKPEKIFAEFVGILVVLKPIP